MIASASQVLAFWREAGEDKWFKKDAAFDDAIRRRFLETHQAAAAGQLAEWEESREGALAPGADPRDLAGAIARTALSHYIFPETDRAAARRQIRAAAGLFGRA